MFIVPYIRSWFDMKTSISSPANYSYDFFILFSQINMEGCVAASIKLGKLWFIKQQEIDLIEQEKQKLRPHEEKGLIQPAFLTDFLTRMEIIANEKPLVAATIHERPIRHLLLYILYENALNLKVPLHKEFALLQEYIDLEKLTAEKEVNVNVIINTSASYETIALSIMLPLC